MRAGEAYTRRIIGEGSIFKERERERALCPECGKETAKGSLVTYLQNQHIVAKGGLGSEGGKADGGNRGDDPRTYISAFPARAGPSP